MFHRLLPVPFLCFLCALAPTLGASGQTPASKLDEIKTQYAEEVSAAERDLKEKYIAALERIQQNLQAQAKLEDALAVKREREKIEAELAASATAPTTPGTPGSTPSLSGSEFTFKPADATPLGDVELVEKWDSLTGWRNQNSGAEWDLSAVPQGVYSLTIEYSCPIPGGSLRIQQGSAFFDFAVPATGGWSSFDAVPSGQIVVGTPPAPLRILVVEDGGTPFGLLNLRSITLKKIGG